MHPTTFRLGPTPIHQLRQTTTALARILLLLICAAVAQAVPVARAETPDNSGFEVVSGSFAASWTKTNNTGYVTLNTAAANARAGNNSIKIDDTSASDSGGARSNPLAITPGHRYIASVKCRLDSGTVASLYLEYRNDAGTLLSGQSYHADCQPVTGAWQAITVIPEDPTTKAVLAAPSGATNVTLLVYSPQAQQGVVYFDNVTLSDVTNATVPNDSFETLSGGFPTNWTKPYANGYESSTTTRAYVGSRSLKIDDPSSSGTGGVRSDPVPVIAGRKYLGAVKCYLESGTQAALYLEYWNREGTKMLSYSTTVSGTGVWQDIVVTPEEPVSREQIVAPYGASHLTLLIYSPQAHVGVAYFDHAQVLVDNLEFATAGVTIANAGFESADGTGFPLEWTRYAANGYESGSAAKFYAGTRSVRINDPSTTAAGGVESKMFPVIEGKSYTASLRYFIESASTSSQFRLYVRYFDNEADLTPRSYTPDEYLGSTYLGLATRGSWQGATYDFTPPFLAKYASLLIYSTAAGNGDGYFDAFGIAAKANGLSNGGFEDVGLGGYPHSWAGYNNTANVTTAASTARFSEIAHSLKIVDTSAAEGGGARSNRITAVTAGKAYTASAMYYLESGSLDLYLEFWDASDTRIAVTTATVSTTGSWQPVAVTATAPAGTTYATLLIYSSQAGTCVGYADAATFESEVVAAGGQRQLFIDDYVIKTLGGVTKVFNPGTIANGGNPLLEKSEAWESNYLICYGSLVYDPVAANYRLYYSTNGNTCYAVSSDGETGWTKPNLGVFNYGGNTANNIVADTASSPTESNIGLGIVRNPNESNPAKLYRAFGKWKFDTSDPGARPAWYKMYASADGKTFSTVLDAVNGWDVGTMAYDTGNARFVASAKYYDNLRRVHRMTTSTNGDTWSVPVRNESVADAVDAAGHIEADSYGLGWYPYEGVYIGFNWVFHIDSGYDAAPGGQVGLVTPQLVLSRDLAEAWYRPTRAALIPRGAGGTWNDGVYYTASNAVTKGDKVLLYFSAADAAHGQGGISKIGLATWRLDGFASLNSTATEGTVLTKKMTFSGTSLRLNVDSAGAGNYVKVELLDSAGAAISGFAKADSATINTDNTNVTVTWNGNSSLAALAGQTIQLRFHCKNARLYAFQFQ